MTENERSAYAHQNPQPQPQRQLTPREVQQIRIRQALARRQQAAVKYAQYQEARRQAVMKARAEAQQDRNKPRYEVCMGQMPQPSAFRPDFSKADHFRKVR
jgi:hypothetical protein